MRSTTARSLAKMAQSACARRWMRAPHPRTRFASRRRPAPTATEVARRAVCWADRAALATCARPARAGATSRRRRARTGAPDRIGGAHSRYDLSSPKSVSLPVLTRSRLLPPRLGPRLVPVGRLASPCWCREGFGRQRRSPLSGGKAIRGIYCMRAWSSATRACSPCHVRTGPGETYRWDAASSYNLSVAN